jgi:hypothetical protein
MLQMLREDTNTLNGECRIITYSFVLTAASMMGTLHKTQWDTGCPHSVHNVWMEMQILEVGERQPTIHTRHPAACMVTSHTSVHLTLQAEQFNPYHIQSLQELVPHNTPARFALPMVGFSNSRLNALCLQRKFYSWTTHDSLGVDHQYSQQKVWSIENTYAIRSHHQWQSSCNLRTGTYVTAPHRPSHYTGTS